MAAFVEVYENGLIRALHTDGKKWNTQVAREVMVQAIQWCPTGSGYLASCHGITQNRDATGFTFGFNVYNDAVTKTGRPLALFIHNGTGIYGPSHTPIVPKYTAKKMFLHLPPHMGFRWSLSTKVIGGGPKRKGVRRPFTRIFDPSDPYGHARSASGNEGNPWLLDAGLAVSARHAF